MFLICLMSRVGETWATVKSIRHRQYRPAPEHTNEIDEINATHSYNKPTPTIASTLGYTGTGQRRGNDSSESKSMNTPPHTPNAIDLNPKRLLRFGSLALIV